MNCNSVRESSQKAQIGAKECQLLPSLTADAVSDPASYENFAAARKYER
jgi:hypothetical protein